jgi:hypothetical protein
VNRDVLRCVQRADPEGPQSLLIFLQGEQMWGRWYFGQYDWGQWQDGNARYLVCDHGRFHLGGRNFVLKNTFFLYELSFIGAGYSSEPECYEEIN